MRHGFVFRSIGALLSCASCASCACALGATLLAADAAAAETSGDARPRREAKSFAVELFDGAEFWDYVGALDGVRDRRPSAELAPARLRIRPVFGGGSGIGLMAVGTF
ncbi:MAG TPA: hypothetical protein VHE30_30225 [Polyangiaceae bacterium]|nr:hypothetical protein [Polyangiaceae bacterium]